MLYYSSHRLWRPQAFAEWGVTFLSIIKKQYLSVIEYHCNEPYYAFQGTAKGGVTELYT